VRQFRELLADRIDDYQEGRIAISDESIQMLRYGQIFVLGEDRLDSVANDDKLLLNTLGHAGYLARGQEVQQTGPTPDEPREMLAAKIYEVAEETESTRMGIANVAFIFAASDVTGDEAPAALMQTMGKDWLNDLAASMSLAYALAAKAGDAKRPIGLEGELLAESFRYGYWVRLCEESV
jgi:hypothetical protein